jgi:hypothetical protein
MGREEQVAGAVLEAAQPPIQAQEAFGALLLITSGCRRLRRTDSSVVTRDRNNG